MSPIVDAVFSRSRLVRLLLNAAEFDFLKTSPLIIPCETIFETQKNTDISKISNFSPESVTLSNQNGDREEWTASSRKASQAKDKSIQETERAGADDRLEGT